MGEPDNPGAALDADGRSEHRFRALLEATPDPIVIVNGEGVIELVNGQALRMFGFAREELVGHPVEVLVPERFGDHTGHRARYMTAPSVRPMGAELELWARRKDGSEIPVEISLSPLEIEGETLVLAALRDVSARREADAELREREHRFRVLLEATPDPIVIVNGDGVIELVNGRTEEVLGYRRGELVGQRVEVLVPERFGAHAEHRARYLKSPSVRPMGAELELWARRKDGREIPVEISLSPIETEDDVLVLAALRDVTARREAEDELRRSESRVRSILTSAHDAFISMDTEGRITEWNPAAERTFGWAADEVIGKTVAETLVPPAMQNAHWRGLRRFLDTGDGPLLGRPVEVTAMRSDGREIPIEISITAMRSGDSWVFHAFARDISGRHRRDRHRAAQHAVAETLAESSAAEEAMEKVLPALCRTLGWELGEFWVADPASGNFRCRATWHAPGVDAPEFERMTRELELAPGQGLVGRVERDGRITWLEDIGAEPDLARAPVARREGIRATVAVPLRRGRDVVGVIGLLSTEARPRDDEVTEVLAAVAVQAGEFIGRRLAEEEAERVKDEFFSLISHELRTPLTSILGYTELLVEVEGEDLSDEARRFVEVIERNARRELRLVVDLLLLTRIEAGTFRVDLDLVDLTAIVREAAEVARPLAEKSGIDLRVELEDVPAALGDLERLGQVVDNLLSNAVKFTPEGGRVSLRLARMGEGKALIEVADTGIGVPEGAVERLFDRMYRTEDAERLQIQGTGLGLTIVKAIVEAHDGEIEVESALGKGMVIRIALPLRAESESEEAADVPAEGVAR